MVVVLRLFGRDWIDASFRGGIGTLVTFSVVFGGLLAFAIADAVRDGGSPWLIVGSFGLLAFGVSFGVRMVRGSRQARKRLTDH